MPSTITSTSNDSDNDNECEIVQPYTGEQDTTVNECECLYDFKWTLPGYDCVNINLCCQVCLDTYRRGY